MYSSGDDIIPCHWHPWLGEGELDAHAQNIISYHWVGTGTEGVAEYEYECLASARGQTVDKQEMQEEDAQEIYIYIYTYGLRRHTDVLVLAGVFGRRGNIRMGWELDEMGGRMQYICGREGRDDPSVAGRSVIYFAGRATWNATWERNGDSDSQQRIWNATKKGTRQRREKSNNTTQQNNRTNGDKSIMVPCGARKGAGLIPTFSTTHTLMRVHLCERTWARRRGEDDSGLRTISNISRDWIPTLSILSLGATATSSGRRQGLQHSFIHSFILRSLNRVDDVYYTMNQGNQPRISDLINISNWIDLILIRIRGRHGSGARWKWKWGGSVGGPGGMSWVGLDWICCCILSLILAANSEMGSLSTDTDDVRGLVLT
ncbi:hypothetical protein B0H13DRAFT_1893064 [Mycena leptocephala]|nr:hypothetical protein B0H13DRAFT_1893064 [Mycena leptocephala]